MRIYANTTFLDKFDRFEEGQTYEVNDGRGHGFTRESHQRVS